MNEKGRVSGRKLIVWGAALLVFVLTWVFFSFIAALFVTLFIVLAALRIDARIPLLIAVALLVVCPFLMIMKQDGAARVFADLTYYFLASGVVLLFIDHLRKEWRPEADAQNTEAGDD